MPPAAGRDYLGSNRGLPQYDHWLGAMGNVWGHLGSAITVYVNPARYTFEYMQEKNSFPICFFPEKYRKDVMTQSPAGMETKWSLPARPPKLWNKGWGLSRPSWPLCAKSRAVRVGKTPEPVRNGIYTKFEPHYFYIGSIVDAFGGVK